MFELNGIESVQGAHCLVLLCVGKMNRAHALGKMELADTPHPCPAGVSCRQILITTTYTQCAVERGFLQELFIE